MSKIDQIFSLFCSLQHEPITITKTRDRSPVPRTRKASITFCLRCFHRPLRRATVGAVHLVGQTWNQPVQLLVQLERTWIFRQFWQHSHIVRFVLVEIEYVRNVALPNPIGNRHILLRKPIPPIDCTKTSRAQKNRIENSINFF